MTLRLKSFVARVVLGVVTLAGVAAAVPAFAHLYDGRDWRNDRGWAERGDTARYDGASGYESYRRHWRPGHYSDRDHGRVVYVHGHGRRW